MQQYCCQYCSVFFDIAIARKNCLKNCLKIKQNRYILSTIFLLHIVIHIFKILFQMFKVLFKIAVNKTQYYFLNCQDSGHLKKKRGNLIVFIHSR